MAPVFAQGQKLLAFSLEDRMKDCEEAWALEDLRGWEQNAWWWVQILIQHFKIFSASSCPGTARCMVCGVGFVSYYFAHCQRLVLVFLHVCLHSLLRVWLVNKGLQTWCRFTMVCQFHEIRIICGWGAVYHWSQRVVPCAAICVGIGSENREKWCILGWISPYLCPNLMTSNNAVDLFML